MHLVQLEDIRGPFQAVEVIWGTVEVPIEARSHATFRAPNTPNLAFRAPPSYNFSNSLAWYSSGQIVLQIVLFERPLRAPNRAFRAPPSCSKSCSKSCFLSAPFVLQIVLFERPLRAPNRAPNRACRAPPSCSKSCFLSARFVQLFSRIFTSSNSPLNLWNPWCSKSCSKSCSFSFCLFKKAPGKAPNIAPLKP